MQSFQKILLIPVAVAGLITLGVLLPLPDVELLSTHTPLGSSFRLQDSSTSAAHQNAVPLQKISLNVVRAIVSSEDDSFFRHHGFNWQSLKSAWELAKKHKTFKRGGSTLTQQLARTLFLSRDKTLLRKIREAVLAYRLEKSLGKLRLLELYLNVAEMGPGIYGIQSAAKYHFNSNPASLSTSQAALIAAILPSPKRWGKKPYSKTAFSRQNRILYAMHRYELSLPEALLARAQKPIKKSSPQEDQ